MCMFFYSVIYTPPVPRACVKGNYSAPPVTKISRALASIAFVYFPLFLNTVNMKYRITPVTVPSLIVHSDPAMNMCVPLLFLILKRTQLKTIHSAPSIMVPSPAFQQALADHAKDLSPAEKHAFDRGNTISIESLMSQINLFDETHRQTSRSRRCAERVQQFLTALQSYLKGLAPFLQKAEPMSALVIGGANLIIDVSI